MPDSYDATEPEANRITLPPPASRWRRFLVWLRQRRVAAALVVVIVLVVGGVVYWLSRDVSCGGADSDVHEIDGQCIGVTDGGYAFHESYADIERKIAAENAAVSGSGHTVTMALLDPLTVTDTSAVTLEQVRTELEGAYTAQYRINHTAAVGDQRPLVKLVLANWGSHQLQWQRVVEQLEGMVDDPDPLVAVVGLRLSKVETKRAAQHLARRNIPVVSAIATADELNYGNIKGFVRASPPNVEYVAALRRYLQRRPDLSSAMLVYDLNSDIGPEPGSDSGTDLFTRSLREDFDKGLPFTGSNKFPAQGFVGTSGQTGAPADLFTNITTNMCAVRPKVVLYAGRVVDFSGFLDSLHNRVCPNTPVTLLAAGADFGLLRLRDQQEELRDKNISVVYATETDPNGWLRNAPGTPPNFKAFYDEFRKLGFNPDHLDDGAAISTHDALLIAAKAARLSTRAHPDHAVPTHSGVLSQMLNLNSLDVVPGASGQLSFSFRGPDSGNPSNKPVPVIEIPSSATAETAAVHHTK